VVSPDDADPRYAEFRKADLRAAVLSGVRLGRASLSGAKLDHTAGLSQSQLDNMVGDAATTIPEGLQRPVAWNQEQEVSPPGAASLTPVDRNELDAGIFAAILSRPGS
jgi:uncharacterized protein YjbI with pentapeptide repeats